MRQSAAVTRSNSALISTFASFELTLESGLHRECGRVTAANRLQRTVAQMMRPR